MPDSLASSAPLDQELASALQRIEQLEAQLRQLAQQNEALLHELNHRVGNNLAVLLGVLDRERAAERSGLGSETAMKLSRFIRGLSVVHRLLSETGWQPLRLATLCRAVLESVAASARPAVRVRVADTAIEVSSRVAERIAVVLSELTINSLRHCGGREAVDIELQLHAREDEVVFEYRDSGPGYPSGVLGAGSWTGGLGLVSEVARHGLAGSLTLSNDSGATARLTFRGLQ